MEHVYKNKSGDLEQAAKVRNEGVSREGNEEKKGAAQNEKTIKFYDLDAFFLKDMLRQRIRGGGSGA